MSVQSEIERLRGICFAGPADGSPEAMDRWFKDYDDNIAQLETLERLAARPLIQRALMAVASAVVLLCLSSHYAQAAIIAPRPIEACVQQEMGMQAAHEPALYTEGQCPPGMYACYRGGKIRGKLDNPYTIAHEYVHYLQDRAGRFKPPISDDARRALESEAYRIQYKCGRVAND